MKLNKIFIFVFAALFLMACGEDDRPIYKGVSESSFVSKDGALFSAANQGDKIYVEVGVSKAIMVDRTIEVDVVFDFDDDDVVAGKQAREGVEYTINKSVVIPAGEVIGKIEITPNLDVMGETQWNIDLMIKDSEDMPVAGYRSTLSFNIVKFIAYDPSVLPGQYVEVGYEDDGEYTLTATDDPDLFEIDLGASTIKVRFFGGDSPTDKFYTEMDESAVGKVWIAGHPTYGDIRFYTLKQGSFSMFGPTFSIAFDGENGTYLFPNNGYVFKKVIE